MSRRRLEIGPRDPKVGQFMIHIPGEGHDDVFDTVEDARAAAKAEKRGSPRLAVYILQVVGIA